MGRAPGFSLALLGPALALLVSQGSLGLFWGSLKTLLVPLYESLGLSWGCLALSWGSHQQCLNYFEFSGTSLELLGFACALLGFQGEQMNLDPLNANQPKLELSPSAKMPTVNGSQRERVHHC